MGLYLGEVISRIISWSNNNLKKKPSRDKLLNDDMHFISLQGQIHNPAMINYCSWNIKKNKIYIDIQTDGAITKGCTSRRVYILTGIELNLFTNWSVYNPGIYGYHNSVYISYKKGQGKFK